MRIKTLLTILLPLGIWLGAQACSSDNEPSVTENELSGGSNDSEPEPTDEENEPASEPTASEPEGEPESEPDDTGGASGESFDPPCDLTLSVGGEEIKKGVACTEDDPQLCYRKCGPQSSGWKTETCTSGVYAEGNCTFPSDGDYSCYAIPDEIDAAACPADIPQASEECDVAECTLCNQDGQYFDSSGNSKVGYCICQAPNSAGTRTWSCSSGTAWPCPLGQGC